MRLYQVPIRLITELVINSLEDFARRAVMAEENWATLVKIVTCLEGLFREHVTIPELGL